MPTPKYGRRKVRIDPRLPVPPGIEDVEIDFSTVNNGYTGGVVRDERPTNIQPTDPAPVTSGNNPWGVAKVKDQALVINADGVLVVEVTFELPNWTGGYDARVSRV
jgi:hypothetical protein